jgi:hypothetical protein
VSPKRQEKNNETNFERDLDRMLSKGRKDAVDEHDDVEFVDNVYRDIEKFNTSLKSFKI